ncbi:MAG: hypothetical protein LBN40_01905 [Oscillospiraceae bacterium]|jgi:transcriptional regulator of arginine metabolism|nr:hypothetical protein [Oscillospiraceae bacterium]
MNRKKRLSDILAIIRENEVENQEQLIALLSERGHVVTQATVSRDINELRLEKSQSSGGQSVYCLSSAKPERYSGLFSQAVTGVDFAGNLVVLKCHPGLAGAAAAALDGMKLRDVLGSIAGDDTIFIAVRGEAEAKDLANKLLIML